MGSRSGIEWTERTWNPWMGCDKVSPGCAHCYMFREQERYGQDPATVRRSKTNRTTPTRWPEPSLIFTCSWSDWFHPDADEWRNEAWSVIRDTPQHTYQILTKRPELIVDRLPDDWGYGYPNVWLGVSVENQRWLGRWHVLETIPAAVRWVSAEPLLGPLTFRSGPCRPLMLDWLVVGGESGPQHRPMKAEWVRDLADECGEWGVPLFFKQWGGWPDKRGGDKAILDGATCTEMPEFTVSEGNGEKEGEG